MHDEMPLFGSNPAHLLRVVSCDTGVETHGKHRRKEGSVLCE